MWVAACMFALRARSPAGGGAAGAGFRCFLPGASTVPPLRALRTGRFGAALRRTREATPLASCSSRRLAPSRTLVTCRLNFWRSIRLSTFDSIEPATYPSCSAKAKTCRSRALDGGVGCFGLLMRLAMHRGDASPVPVSRRSRLLHLVRHPLRCVLLGHWISFVETRGAFSEYVCRTCGHPFWFKRAGAVSSP